MYPQFLFMDAQLLVILLIPFTIAISFIYVNLTKGITKVSDKYKAPHEVILQIDLSRREVHIQKGKELFRDQNYMPYESFVSNCKVESRVKVNEILNELSNYNKDAINPKRLEIIMKYKGNDVPYILQIQKYHHQTNKASCYLKYNPIANVSEQQYNDKKALPFTEFDQKVLKQSKKLAKQRHVLYFIKISGAEKLAETFENTVARSMINETVKRVTHVIGSKAVIAKDKQDNIWVYRRTKKIDRRSQIKYLKNIQNEIQKMKLKDAVKIQTKLIIGTTSWDKKMTANILERMMKQVLFAQKKANHLDEAQYFFTDKDLPEFKKQLRMVNEIRSAIEKKEVEINYQPITSLKKPKVLAYTVNSKLPKVKYNFLQVIDLVDTYLGSAMFNELLIKAVIDKTKKSKVDIHINFDAKIATNLNSFASLLYEWGWSEKTHVLELTNTRMLTTEKLKFLCKQLRNNKIRYCLDNFDANHLSHSTIGVFKPESIKISRFVNDIHNNDQYMIKVIDYVRECDAKGIKLIASRVENEFELYVLTRIGVSAAEGYYIGKPLEKMESISLEISDEIKNINKNLFVDNK